jgi:hypothetical protein
MKAIKLIALAVIAIFLAQTASMAQDVKIEVVDFHSTNRCYTCNVIEAYAKKTVETHFADKKNVSFSVFNVDEPNNKPVLQEFRAFGFSQFAFMNARNEERFVAGLKQEIEKHLGS